MNTSKESAMELALRKHVERAVRPVRAAESRKLRMREEPLAHLSAIYREEMEHQGSADSALAAACRRFGAPHEVAAELDASIGAIERWEVAVDRWLLCLIRSSLQFRSGEALWRSGLRILGWLAVINLIVFAAVPAASMLIHGWVDDPTTLPLLPKVFVLLVATQWIAVVAAQIMERTVQRQVGWQAWLKVAGQSLFWSLLMLLLAAGFWFSVTRELAAPVFVRLMLSLFSVVPLLMLWSAWLVQQDQRRQQQYRVWTMLALDE